MLRPYMLLDYITIHCTIFSIDVNYVGIVYSYVVRYVVLSVPLMVLFNMPNKLRKTVHLLAKVAKNLRTYKYVILWSFGYLI